MVNEVPYFSFPELFAERLQRLDQGEVNDPASALRLNKVDRLHDFGKFLVVTPDVSDFKAEIGAIDSFVVEGHFIGGKTQLPDNIGLHFRGRRCRQCNGCRVIQQTPELFESSVVRPKIMPPLTDAVRFIYCE